MELLQLYTKRLRLYLGKELSGILISMAAFFLFPILVRQLDPSAAPIDPGILSAVLLTIASLLIFQAATWWAIRVIWPVFYTYSIHHFENNFKSLEPWQKVIIYLSVYCLLLFAFILILLAIL